MPQKRIPLQPEYFYHIWTHANGDEDLFRSEDNYSYFLDRYLHHVHPVVETYAYCLMPNHLHLMVRVKSEEELAEFFRKMKGDPTLTLQGFGTKVKYKKNLQGFEILGGLVSQQFSNLFNAYTKAFNKMYNRKGSLFIPNFNRKLIDSDEYFVRLIAYIHNNPIHHGFTNNPNDWPFSSWHAYVLNRMTRVKKDEAIQWFGDVENFKEVHREINMEKCIQEFEF